MNIRTTHFVFIIFYKILWFWSMCIGQDFQNEIFADNPCHRVFLLNRGDYRTGKRLNMRKVIPYIASQFRKDKIWLRRTKPSKRQYQICLAIDDSSSMTDNHSKQVKENLGGSIWRNYLLLMSMSPSDVSYAELVAVGKLDFGDSRTALSWVQVLELLSLHV